MSDTPPEIAEMVRALLMARSGAGTVPHGGGNVRGGSPDGVGFLAYGYHC